MSWEALDRDLYRAVDWNLAEVAAERLKERSAVPISYDEAMRLTKEYRRYDEWHIPEGEEGHRLFLVRGLSFEPVVGEVDIERRAGMLYVKNTVENVGGRILYMEPQPAVVLMKATPIEIYVECTRNLFD